MSNILLIMTDQHRHDFLGRLTSAISTPDLARLAQHVTPRGKPFVDSVGRWQTCSKPMLYSPIYPV